VAVFPEEIAAPVRRIAEQSNHIVHWSEFDRGGHFAAMEEPDLLMHAVHAEDQQVFREAMEPTLRASRLGDRRFTASGLTVEDALDLTGGLLDFADRPRTGPECEAWLAGRLGAPMPPLAWRMLRQYAPLWHAPTDGPWSFGSRAYASCG
jgi:hypothetical protein